MFAQRRALRFRRVVYSPVVRVIANSLDLGKHGLESRAGVSLQVGDDAGVTIAESRRSRANVRFPTDFVRFTSRSRPSGGVAEGPFLTQPV